MPYNINSIFKYLQGRLKDLCRAKAPFFFEDDNGIFQHHGRLYLTMLQFLSTTCSFECKRKALSLLGIIVDIDLLTGQKNQHELLQSNFQRSSFADDYQSLCQYAF